MNALAWRGPSGCDRSRFYRFVGVPPSVIQDATELKTCNISEVADVQVVNGMMVLDTYLAHRSG